MLLKCCTQYVSKFGKLRNGHRTEKGQFSLNFNTIALISRASKVMLKFLQARLTDVHTKFRKGRGTRDPIVNSFGS